MWVNGGRYGGNSRPRKRDGRQQKNISPRSSIHTWPACERKARSRPSGLGTSPESFASFAQATIFPENRTGERFKREAPSAGLPGRCRIEAISNAQGGR